MGPALPSQAFWEGGCCLPCPRVEGPETSDDSDFSSRDLTLNMRRGPKALSTLRWCPQESSQMPALSHLQLTLALEEEGLSCRSQQSKCSPKKPARLPKCWPPLCPHPYPSLLSALGKSRAFPFLRLTRTRAGDGRKLEPPVHRAWGGHGHGVPAAGWPL